MYKPVSMAMFLASAASATAGTLDLPNQIANGEFEKGGWTPWMQSSLGLFNQGQDDIPINTAGGQKWAGQILRWNGSYNGPSGSLRQVTDATQFPGWEPAGTGRLIDIEFDYLLDCVGSDPQRMVGLRVYLDWQDDGSKPPVPDSPGYERQLVYEEWQCPDTQAPQWKHADIRLALPFQPRFLGLAFESHVHFPNVGVVGIDNVDLESRCLPEPPNLAMLVCAGVPLLRRRHLRICSADSR
ncbi:MAG: hypothetical protein ACUVXJ_06190 [Phycisphaerae bacterium]